MVASTDGSETRAPKVWISRNVTFNDDAFPYRRGSAVTQGESEDDDASQSDVDDLKSGSDEQCETTSTKTHANQGGSEDKINPDEGTPNVTDSTTAVQQTDDNQMFGKDSKGASTLRRLLDRERIGEHGTSL